VPLPKNLVGKITGEPDTSPDPPVVTVPQPVMDRAGVRCRVCAHPQRHEIEKRYVTATPAGIAKWLSEDGHERIPASVIKKHFEVCVVGELILSKGAQQSAENFRARTEKLVSRLEGYLDEFDDQDSEDVGGIKSPKDWKGLAAVVNQLRASLELFGKACGHLGPDNVINIIESPQFQTVITTIAQITVQCPHCGPAVKNVLTDGDV
jgi:hypothetical protein